MCLFKFLGFESPIIKLDSKNCRKEWGSKYLNFFERVTDLKNNFKIQTDRIHKALSFSWSLESSSKWSIENPAMGQCGVTSLVVNDLLGGEISKTKLPDGWHFYNFINGIRYDFTASQFKESIHYMDFPSNREEAFLDTNDKQYTYLKQSVFLYLDTSKQD